MADVVVVGGGVVGLCGSLLLARDGHRVTLLERDPAPPPPSPDDAWTGWERRGVNQFRMLHYFLPRFREILDAELPDVAAALDGAGALRTNVIDSLPAHVTGGTAPRRRAVHCAHRPPPGRRVRHLAGGEPRAGSRDPARCRGAGSRDRHRAPAGSGSPGWSASSPTPARSCAADLVVDASGRRSPLPRLARSRRRPPARGGAGGLGLRVLRPPLPLARRICARRRSVRRSSPTTRCRSCCCPPTTARGAWA